jgi:hypothetical protein
MHKCLFLIYLFISSIVSAQSDSSLYVNKSILIIASSKNYIDAKKTAVKAGEKLAVKLDLRGLMPNKKTGLTYSKEVCEEDGVNEYPCYISRGRYDDGKYISIEYSNAFTGFAKGYYIVVYASGERDFVSGLLKKVKKSYTSAYVKQCKVYIGCLH